MAFTPLNALHAFVAVARRRSFVAAARDLGVSTSALSQSVRQLEARVETALLTRTSRSVALTEAGERLLADAGPAVDQALASLEGVAARRGEILGRVRLSVPSAAVPLVLARLLPEVRARHPKIEVDVMTEDHLVDIVARGLDAGIRLVEAIDRDMVHVRLSGPSRFVVAASPSYLERRGVPARPEDLLHHDCVGMRWAEGREPWIWELERGRRTWRVPVRGVVTTNDATLMKSLAVSGVGLFYTFEPLIAEEVARDQLRVVLEAYAPEVPGLFLYFPPGAQVSPAFRAFVDVARELTARPGRRKRAP